ncbi:hypothetical protein JCM39194_22250 [Desulfotomaculum varum]
MVPFSYGLRTDSTMISSGRHWVCLKRDAGAHIQWAPPNGSFRSSSAVTGASTNRWQGIIKPPRYCMPAFVDTLQLSTVT